MVRPLRQRIDEVPPPQLLHRYLSHAFRSFEHLAAESAADTPIAQLLLEGEEILDT